MKKLLLIILSIVMAFSTAVMFGCGEPSAFDGNYQEVDAQGTEMEALCLAHEEADVKEITMGSGISFKVEYTMTMEDMSMDVSMDMDLLEVEGVLQMQGKMEMKGMGTDLTADIWYNDGYMYMNAKADGQTQKAKMSMDIDEFIGMYTDGVNTSVSFAEAIDEYLNSEDSKFYIDDSGETKKVKIDVADGSEGETIEGSLYFLFDANYNLIGAKTEMELASEDFGSMDILVEMQAFTGTSINLPTDLGSYIYLPM